MKQTRQLALQTLVLPVLVAVSIAGCGDDGAGPGDSVDPPATNAEHTEPSASPPSAFQQFEPPDSLVDPAVVDPGPPTVPDRPLVLYRPTWKRPTFSDAQLQRAMLERYTVPGFELITDMGPEKSRPLLTLVQPLHRFHESYFGPLPAAEDASAYEITAFVMRDQTLFDNAGMLPDGGLLAFHGRQIGPQFWMNDQPWDYYRRHLLLHEATHAYMRHLPGYAEDLPPWYLEGMAELLATHTINELGKVEFNVMPADPEQFIGHERIAIVRRDGQRNGLRSIEQITSSQASDFASVETYAWCWALCRFLDSHPRYQNGFRKIARELITKPFDENLSLQFEQDNDQLRVEWAAFASGIEYAYDFERNEVAVPDGQPLRSPVTLDVHSDRGWQTTGITIEPGQQLSVTASGRFTLADVPKPWTSEANGISFRYYDGQPLGRLLATVISLDDGLVTMSRPRPLGNAAMLTAPGRGTLYLRLNDHWGELADNRGSVQVTLQPMSARH